MVVLRREGFQFRSTFPVRGMGLRATGRAALWLVLSTVMYQASSLTSLTVGTRSGALADQAGFSGRGYTSLFFAQSIILVVTAVVVASASTVLLQRLSQHYNAGDREAASADLRDVMIRVASVTVPIAAVLVALGPLIGEVLFARGNTSVDDARFIGVVLSILAVGLLPNALHNVMLRPFFATSDGRSPFFSALRVCLVAIAISLLAYGVLPPEWVVIGVVVGYPIAFIVEIPFKLRRLRSGVGFTGAPDLRRRFVWLIVGGVVAGTVTGVSAALIEPLVPHEFLTRLLLAIALGIAFLGIYHLITRRSGASLVDLYRWMLR
jgi:putative peptidoglycan lipid II flippase